MPDQRDRSRIRARDAVAVALGFILAFAAFVAVYSSRGSSSVAPKPKPHPLVRNEQVLLQSSIINDREHLFSGVLTFPLPNPMPVESTQELDITLTAIGKHPAPGAVPYDNVIGSRSLQVGGVEGATLSVRGSGVQISSVGPAHPGLRRVPELSALHGM